MRVIASPDTASEIVGTLAGRRVSWMALDVPLNAVKGALEAHDRTGLAGALLLAAAQPGAGMDAAVLIAGQSVDERGHESVSPPSLGLLECRGDVWGRLSPQVKLKCNKKVTLGEIYSVAG
jgi:hypothetical protein